MHCLNGRVLKPELLDTVSPEEARASLADLVRINRDWGGYSTLRRLVGEQIPADQPFSLLDVGAASGDMGREIRKARPLVKVTSLDYLASHLAACDGTKVTGDAFHLPFAAKSFDYVFCSLFLHHFTDAEVVELLRGFGQLARRAVLVIDLLRDPMAYYFIPWTQWLFRWDPITVNDGAISVEAAFKPRELESLARQAGLKNPRARSYRPAYRIALSAAVD